MAEKRNYIIGKAELLSSLKPPPKMNPNSVPIYTFSEVMGRLKPQFKHTVSQLNKLDDDACPRDFAVAAITLHPSYIAKGHFPRTLFKEMSVRSIGSKGVDVLPDRWTRVGEPVPSPTTKIFVAGKRDRLTEFSQELDNFSEQTRGAADLFHIWSVAEPEVSEKIKQNAEGFEGFWEVGLQLMPLGNNDFIKSAFISYAQELGFVVKDKMAIEVGSLWFMPIAGNECDLNRLATFAFLRVVRPLPSLRSFRPLTRGVPVGANEYRPARRSALRL
ncbi:hypothetical protein [Phytobacter diazotrophicus]|uniref:hypothetical protein n=1 Tax=Phytobacter diazotrophicus TaxID=395631 RepID=UPI001CC4379A|nr:hypothetical protein [Phytobacter diazotrophicus]